RRPLPEPSQASREARAEAAPHLSHHRAGTEARLQRPASVLRDRVPDRLGALVGWRPHRRVPARRVSSLLEATRARARRAEARPRFGWAQLADCVATTGVVSAPTRSP